MALAYEPDISGFLVGPEPLEVPRWSEPARNGQPSSTFASLALPAEVVELPLDRPVLRQHWTRSDRVEDAAPRSIYDLPINPLPAPRLDEPVVPAGNLGARPDAVVLPFVRPDAEVHDVSAMDYRPVWVGASFLAATLCASVTVASSWFAVAPAEATSSAQRVASQTTALIGVTGLASLAAVLSTALLLVGAQRTS